MWPPYCCVPAFLERAIVELGDIGDRNNRRRAELARACNVSLPPETDNPLKLPVSRHPDDWGASPVDAIGAFVTAQAILDARQPLELSLHRLDQVAFELYEEVVLDQSSEDTVIGIGFNYQDVGVPTREVAGPTMSRHLVRITPLGAEMQWQPNVRSTDFRPDYRGEIHVFDDSGELPARTTLSWPKMIRAARLVGGAFWTVSRAGTGSVGQSAT